MHLCIEKCVSIWLTFLGICSDYGTFDRAVLAHHKRRAARIPFMHHDSILTNDMMSGFEYKIGPSHHGSFSREDFFLLSSKTRNNKWWWQDRESGVEQRNLWNTSRIKRLHAMIFLSAAAARKSPCFSTFFGLFSFKHNLNVCVCTLLCIHWTLLKIERPFQLITHPWS